MDRREEILIRLEAIAKGLPGVKTASRNTINLSDGQRPAVVVMDADEDADDAPDPRGAGPQMVTMTPELWVMLASSADAVGPALNALRAALIPAVRDDATLQGLTGRNGAIRYLGAATSLAGGRSLLGEMGLSFAFTYPLKPDELTT